VPGVKKHHTKTQKGLCLIVTNRKVIVGHLLLVKKIKIKK